MSILKKWISRLMERQTFSCQEKIRLAPLFGLSRCYSSIMQLREKAYQSGIFSSQRLPCRVICIGNLTTGGTGKTPLVESVCRTLMQKGERVGIISRGYGRKRKNSEDLVIVSDGERILSSVEEAGDEPLMLAKRLQKVPIIVGKNRALAGKIACERFHCQTLIMDDGFQHLQLIRDLNILVLDGEKPFGNGYCLPLGKLRERPSALKRANLIIVTKNKDIKRREELVKSIRCYNPHAPVFFGSHQPRDFITLQGDKIIPKEMIQGKTIVAFCGIADPSHFEKTLTRLGAKVCSHSIFKDHHWYSSKEIYHLEKKLLEYGAWAIVTTEKDAVRVKNILDFIDHPDLPIWILRTDMVITEGKEEWEKIIAS